MKTFRPRALLFFICLLLVCAGLYPQEEREEQQEQGKKKTDREYKPREQKLYIDIPLAFGEVFFVNFFGNAYWRLWGPDSEVAYFTPDSIRCNLNPKSWEFEMGQEGDTFLVNQFLHPYAGANYFASARSNNINFYWSILYSTFGSFTWEVFGETDTPAINDAINTIFGGMVMGEVLHRLYIEVDKGGIAGKIMSTIVSPADRLTALIRGYGPEEGLSKISGSSFAFGFSYINAKFFDDKNEITSWDTPAAFINFDIVYDNPYTAHGNTPFAQFDLNTSLTVSIQPFYNLTIIIDGYLASWLLADNDTNQASNGITLHLDDYITDKGFMDLNNGRENLSFYAQSLDYSVKWLRRNRNIHNKSFDFSLKTHLGFSPWAITDYNGGEVNPGTGEKDDYNLYLFGGNIKLFMELREINEEGSALTSGALSSGADKGQVLSLSLCLYDTLNLPYTPSFDVNTIFFFSKLAYSLPLTKRLSLYAADSFMLLYCRLTRDAGAEFPDITRWYNSAQLGLKISF